MKSKTTLRFKKRLPEVIQFSPISESSYDFVGGIENDPLQLLILSRLNGGKAYSDKEYTTTTGKLIKIKKGWSWASIPTLREDIFAATGEQFTRAEVVGRLKQAAKYGLVLEDNIVLPSTKGRYGKVYKLSKEVDDFPKMDIVKSYHLFYYGDPKQFNVGELWIPDYNRRERRKDVDGWVNHVSRFGLDVSAFTTIGRWQEIDYVRDPKRPVFIPFLIFDIDDKLIYFAYLTALMILDGLEDVGFDLDSIFVSFSGKKGFHITVPTHQFGSPIFKNGESATLALNEWTKSIVGSIEIDTSVLSPNSMIRVGGSTHNDTGLYKTSWDADTFRSRRFDQLIEDAKNHQSFRYPDIHSDVVQQEVYDNFIDSVGELSLPEKKKSVGKSYVGKKIARIIKGVDESEYWGEDPLDIGRDRAMFVLACWLIEDNEQAEQVASSMGLNTSEPLEVLNSVDKFNNPPLGERYIKSKLRAAKKYLTRKNGVRF